MSEWQTVLQIREEAARKGRDTTAVPGPYVTISRQYGCSGLTVGLLLAEILNDQAPRGRGWHVFGREILDQLARETSLAADLVEQLKLERPRLLLTFFRSLAGERIPSGAEVRDRIFSIVRGLAYQGCAVIVGQGGAGATADIPNGVSIRLEAPLDWRIKQVRAREGCSADVARRTIRRREREREYVREVYAVRFPRMPVYDITYDHSRFTPLQIARHVADMMELKHFV